MSTLKKTEGEYSLRSQRRTFYPNTSGLLWMHHTMEAEGLEESNPWRWGKCRPADCVPGRSLMVSSLQVNWGQRGSTKEGSRLEKAKNASITMPEEPEISQLPPKETPAHDPPPQPKWYTPIKVRYLHRCCGLRNSKAPWWWREMCCLKRTLVILHEPNFRPRPLYRGVLMPCWLYWGGSTTGCPSWGLHLGKRYESTQFFHLMRQKSDFYPSDF